MTSLVLGISMLAHLTIIFAVKAKFFLDSAFNRKNQIAAAAVPENRIFTSLAIAVIMEFVVFLVIVSMVSLVGVSVMSEKSNYKIIKNAYYEFESKSVGLSCLLSKDCNKPSHPDVSIPLS